MSKSLSKREIMRTANQDNREAISLAKRVDYERLMEGAPDFGVLRVIEQQVKTDSRLTQPDRILLLSAVAKTFHV